MRSACKTCLLDVPVEGVRRNCLRIMCGRGLRDLPGTCMQGQL
jgi:hypothetical protein